MTSSIPFLKLPPGAISPDKNPDKNPDKDRDNGSNVPQGNMTTEDVEATCRAIVAAVLEIDESLIQPSSRFREELGADSLDLVTLIMAVSRVFAANICDREVHHIDTYGEAVAYLQRHLVPKEEPVEQEH